ncbi:hypothetical protein DL769_010989 [Monosporascus sp. CRB-8-3]|nr:hypothetical protein DL769_010989 [Monosporascus sp. CRB-8-3]
MPTSAQAHARSHALLLLQKLLNLRDSASPLTLVLDSLEQSSGPVIREFILRAKASLSLFSHSSFTLLFEFELTNLSPSECKSGRQEPDRVRLVRDAEEAPRRRRLRQGAGEIARGAAGGDHLALPARRFSE